MLRLFILFSSLVLTTLSGNLYAAGILIMGDSLSAGYGIEQQSAWPKLLEQQLKREGYRYEVHNASISGETTAGGRTRFAETLQRTQAQIVVLELGANDGLRGLSLKAMRDNLDAMVSAAQSAGAKVLVVGMRMPPNLGQAYTDKFHATFGDVAKARKVSLLPYLFERMTERELFQADGLHPTAAAQSQLLSNIWPHLKALLKK